MDRTVALAFDAISDHYAIMELDKFANHHRIVLVTKRSSNSTFLPVLHTY